MEHLPCDSEPFRSPHCAGLGGAPGSKGHGFLTDVEDVRKGEERDAIVA